MFKFLSQETDALPTNVVGGHAGSFVDLQLLAKNVSTGDLSAHAENLSVESLENFEVRAVGGVNLAVVEVVHGAMMKCEKYAHDQIGEMTALHGWTSGGAG